MKTFSKKTHSAATVDFDLFINSFVHTIFSKKPFVIKTFAVFSSYSQL